MKRPRTAASCSGGARKRRSSALSVTRTKKRKATALLSHRSVAKKPRWRAGDRVEYQDRDGTYRPATVAAVSADPDGAFYSISVGAATPDAASNAPIVERNTVESRLRDTAAAKNSRPAPQPGPIVTAPLQRFPRKPPSPRSYAWSTVRIMLHVCIFLLAHGAAISARPAAVAMAAHSASALRMVSVGPASIALIMQAWCWAALLLLGTSHGGGSSTQWRWWISATLGVLLLACAIGSVIGPAVQRSPQGVAASALAALLPSCISVVAWRLHTAHRAAGNWYVSQRLASSERLGQLLSYIGCRLVLASAWVLSNSALTLWPFLLDIALALLWAARRSIVKWAEQGEQAFQSLRLVCGGETEYE